MNLRVLALLGMASGLLVLTGCPVDTTPNTGGAGGTGGSETTGGKGGTGGTGGVATGGMAGTGGVGGVACDHCAAHITDPKGTVCPGSEALYKALADCTCGAAGKCAMACMTTACAMPQMPPDAACTMCVTDMTKGCGNEFGACSGDI